MDVLGMAAGALWPALSGAAMLALAAALHARARHARRAAALHVEVEALQDRMWELAESEARFRGLVEGQDDLILRRGADGRLTFVNETLARLAGRPAAALVGTDFAFPATETGEAATAPDGARAYDQAIATPEGPRWVSWIETTVRGPGGAPETQAVGRDVTARRQAEAALAEAHARAAAASEAKSRFLANVSHEVRTPLNGVLGMADLLLGTPLDPEQTTYVRAVKTSGEALLSLIDEILDFSRIEAGKLDLARAPFDLSALVEGAVELLAPRAQGKGLEIAAFVAPGVPRRVLGDAARLRQVLVNLAGNAVKFTERGGVGILVEPTKEGIRIEVRDTGIGIPADRLPHVFEEFEQADGSASRRHGGAGLGLAISRRLVAAMGGEIGAESAPGRGSTFTVTLPLALEGGGEAAPAAPPSGRRALVVAASVFEAPFLVRRLGAAGLAAERVETVAEARARLAEGPVPDLLFVDAALGTEARDLAREALQAGVATRTVLLSPFERRAFGPPAAAGFDSYLVKPVRARSLVERIGGAPAAPASPPAPPPAAPSAGQGLHVLLAEDNEINALLAIRLLERAGARVTWARDGVEAAALAGEALDGRRPRFDAVLMDVRMPNLDGRAATGLIRAREREAGAAPVRIVALTANAFEEDRAAALAAGMDAVLTKPLDAASLVAALGMPTAEPLCA